ncbi:MAG: hypothetical protein K0M56_07740 [Kaistella sp.]|nr:hypothetical protein [Kaistella sp.]
MNRFLPEYTFLPKFDEVTAKYFAMENPLEIRIKIIQKNLQVPQTGVFDGKTCDELIKFLGLQGSGISLAEKKKNIQKKLGFTGKMVDGIFGVATLTRIEFFLDKKLPELPKGAVMIISRKSAEMILEFEIGSRARYLSLYQNPIWPEGQSGITIGIGYDLGYTTQAKFKKDWEHLLSPTVFSRLKTVVGLKAARAKKALSTVKNLIIPLDAALEIFYTKSLPEYAAITAKTYPGIGLLPPDAQGALLSLVYNRGAGTEGESRREMKNIRKWIKTKDLQNISDEIRSMKRLWPKTKGLRQRRDREADLVKNASNILQPNDYIFV